MSTTQTTLRRRRIAGERRREVGADPTPVTPPVAPAATTRRAPAPAASAPAAPQRPERASRRRQRLSFAASACLALVTVAAACWLGLHTWSYPDARAHDQAQLAGQRASAAAEQAAPAILSFKYTDLDADLAKATGYMTSNFAKTYTGSFESLAKPNATRTKATVTAKVLATAVVTASDSHAQILVFVDQTTVSTANGGHPSVALNRTTFDLVKQGNRWLVDDFSAY